MNRTGLRVFSRQHNQILCLLVMVSLLLGMVGPMQYPPAREVRAQGASVTLDGTVSVVTADDVQTVDVAHTTGNGADRLLVVGVSWNSNQDARTISSVTFTPDGGSALAVNPVVTQDHGTTTPYRYAAIYGLVNPPSGQPGTVRVTFAEGTVTAGIIVGVANFAGADQATPFGVAGGAYSASNNTTPTVTLSGLNGDELVIDTLFLGGNPPAAVTPGDAQTELSGWNANIANARGAASTEQATSGTVTMSWTAGANSLWVIVAAAINPAPAGTTYDLTVVVDPAGGGTTVPSPGSHTYAEDAVVNLTATAAPGYEFDRWEGGCTGTDPDVCQVTMTEDKTVTAYFVALPQYTLTVDTTGSGSVTLDPDGGTYIAGTTVTLTPASGACYVFSGWAGADAADLTDNGDGTWSITMDGNKSVTAEFDALPPGTPCYRVNCGGDTLTDPDPDILGLHYPGLDTIPGLTVSNVQDERSTTDVIDLSNVDPDLPLALFQTVLIRGTAGQTMSYDFAVLNGDYNVRLHFAEHYFSSAGQREFDITVEDVLVFDDYDVFVAAGGEDIAVTENVATTVSDGVLGIDLTAQVSDAAIRGIEIVPVAETCYALTLGHTGTGTDPVADLANSTGCPTGEYVAGETINLSGAAPGLGWGIAGWYGTDDDESTADTNTVTMPAGAHAAGANYLRLLGDVNLDGLINSSDALLVLSVDVGLPAAEYCPMNYGDVDGDGVVNSTDALIIMTYDAGLPVGTFPVGEPVPEPVLINQPPGCTLGSTGLSRWSWVPMP